MCGCDCVCACVCGCECDGCTWVRGRCFFFFWFLLLVVDGVRFLGERLVCYYDMGGFDDLEGIPFCDSGLLLCILRHRSKVKVWCLRFRAR